VEANLSRVDAGKEVAAEKEIEARREEAEPEEASDKEPAVLEHGAEGGAIGRSKSLESDFEPLLVTAEEAQRLALVLPGVILVRGAQ